MAKYDEVMELEAHTPPTRRNTPFDGMRQLTYAWLGLFGLASDEFGDFYNRCVARGAETVKARRFAVRLGVRSNAPESTVIDPSDEALDRTVPATKTVMNAFVVFSSNVVVRPKTAAQATQTEIDALNERVEALSREVDTLVDQHKQAE